MHALRTALVATALVLAAGTAAAADTGAFVVQLGRDTTAVERYLRTPARVEVEQVGRAPRVLRRSFAYDYDHGSLRHASVTASAPGNPVAIQSIDAVTDGDSLRLTIRNNGGASSQNVAVAFPAGTVMVAGSSPWTGYETATMAFVRGKSDTMSTRMYFLGAPGLNVLQMRRVGRDSVQWSNDHMDVFHARVDRDGHVLGVLPISGTGQFGVTRVATIDVDAYAAGYAAREQSGGGIGTLSPRDTVRASAGGAALWVDYGRPGMRGRKVFGGLVPYGAVWRTGANAATQFRTDKDLDFGGGTVVPAGIYTLWSVVTADGWKLVFNTQTGQWGTEHDAARDKYSVALKPETIPDPVERFTIRTSDAAGGGAIVMEWDHTRVTAPFTTHP